MKTISSYLLVIFITLSVFTACKKMDGKYKQYVVPGGLIYPQQIINPYAQSGHNRIKISWLRGVDPTVVKAKIFWNNYADSVEINIPAIADTISTMIDNLPEKSYSFMIKTYDNLGNSSVPVEIIVGSYGVLYQGQLANRIISSSFIDAPGQFSIQWGTADLSIGAIATEVKYTDALGLLRVKRFDIKDLESKVLDYMPGTTFQYRTLFCPDTISIDTFYTSFIEKKYFNIRSQTAWSVIAMSSQHNTTTWAAKNFLDGINTTGWHTNATTSHYPHFITVDMLKQTSVAGFQLYRFKADDRGCNTFSFSISVDNITWTNMGIFNFNRLTDDIQTYELPSHPIARYFKFTGLSGPQEYEVLGDIKILEL